MRTNSSLSSPNHHICSSNTQLSIAEVSTEIPTTVDESLSKQQKVLLLRHYLAAISAELQRLEVRNFDFYGTGNPVEDEGELNVQARRVDVLPASTEIRRLERIPPQNAEHGVVRNILEWPSALPWISHIRGFRDPHAV